MAKTELKTAPAATPIVIADVNAHLKWDDSSGNTAVDSTAYLTTLISRALDIAETETCSRFYTQTWYEYFDSGFPAVIPLQVQPVTTISAITYTDTAGTTQTLASTVYELGQEDGAGIVRLKYGQTWPATRDHADVIKVEYIVGYGTASTIPDAIRHAMLMIVGSLSAHRGDEGDYTLPRAARELLSQYTFRKLR